MGKARKIAAHHLRRAAVKRILHHAQQHQIDKEDAVDAAEPVVPLLEAPIVPAFGRHADNVLDRLRVADAEADGRAAGVARAEIGRGLADELGRLKAVGRKHETRRNPTPVMKVNQGLVAHADRPLFKIGSYSMPFSRDGKCQASGGPSLLWQNVAKWRGACGGGCEPVYTATSESA
nr:hypothetical protein DBT41_14760 [Aerococcus urinae]